MVLVCTILNQNNLRYWEATEPFRLTKETGIWGTIPAEWSMKANESYTVGETNFREWFAYQSSVAYSGDWACPWTQLGYTFDWHHDSSHIGLSEYVASVGALSYIKARTGLWTFIQRILE